MSSKGPKSLSRPYNERKNKSRNKHKKHKKIKLNSSNESNKSPSIISIDSTQYSPSILSAIDSMDSRQSWAAHPRRSKRIKIIRSKKTSKSKQNEESDKEYVVKKIHAVKWNPKIAKYQYKAEWEGYGREEDSFTEYTDNCIEKVADFWIDNYLNKVMESQETRMLAMNNLNKWYEIEEGIKYLNTNVDNDNKVDQSVLDRLREKYCAVISKATIIPPTQTTVWMSRPKTSSHWVKPKSTRRDISDKQEADDSDAPSSLSTIASKEKGKRKRKRSNKTDTNINK